MKPKRRGGSRLSHALIASALLHGGAIAFFWAYASSGQEMAPLKVYAVNIVSPPPREQGEPAPEQVVPQAEPTPEPQPEAAPPTPEPAPQPVPTPPAPQPRPAPQREQPRTTPREAVPPARREPTPPPRPTTRPTPAPTPAQRPEPAPARSEPPRASSPPPRQGETAARPAPSTGAAPSPASAGGENLAVRTDGAVCPSEAYCNNIAATVKRYFRRPPDSYSDRGDVCFRIARNGTVSDLDVQRLRGSFQFRLALMEAVEQASHRNAFGALPREFGSDFLPVCVGVTPQM